MITSGKCPECGMSVGSQHGVDPFKHAVNCLHVAAGREDDMLRNTRAQNPLKAARLQALLDMAK